MALFDKYVSLLTVPQAVLSTPHEPTGDSQVDTQTDRYGETQTHIKDFLLRLAHRTVDAGKSEI